jgi:DNA-binding NtrC family response regulator
MAKSKVLVVDDELGMLEVCSATLKHLEGVEVIVEQQSQQAAKYLENADLDLLILDIRMPSIGGVDLLRIARERDPNLAVLMITAFPSVETAIECMRLGAADYLAKPFLPEDLLATTKRLLESKRLRDENQVLRRRTERGSGFGEMIGESIEMQEVYRLIEQFAETEVDVLILGETGTGKELVARSIHAQSRRRQNRYMPIDCGAIPEGLLENELFGHERGAFTGAGSRSPGLLEIADKGTFFLDEIGDLSPVLQAKLLRTLQERRLRRVGGVEEIEVDIRVIAATSKDIDDEVAQKRFRPDLFYRINVGRIVVPALRKRPSDIPLLVEHFIACYAPEMGKDIAEVTPDAMEVLSRYAWPGNVRQLQNVVKRAIAVSDAEVLGVSELPDEIVVSGQSKPDGDLGSRSTHGFFACRNQHMIDFERKFLTELLAATDGDITRAAQSAQLPRGTLYRILAKYDLKPRDYRR